MAAFLKLTECNERGTVAGPIYIAAAAIVSMHEQDQFTEIMLIGHTLRRVKEPATDIAEMVED